MERLQHKHIISIIGWKMARTLICDLWAFLEDLEEYRNFLLTIKNQTKLVRHKRSRSLNSKTTRTSFTRYVSAGSIVATVALQMLFLMSTNNISSTKVSNHEASCSLTLWIPDFGALTDFSTIGASVSDGGDQGTPKYRAPEVSERQLNRRSADIFSLGVMFLEMTCPYRNSFRRP
jgi:serine/threonine protein kinase